MLAIFFAFFLVPYPFLVIHRNQMLALEPFGGIPNTEARLDGDNYTSPSCSPVILSPSFLFFFGLTLRVNEGLFRCVPFIYFQPLAESVYPEAMLTQSLPKISIMAPRPLFFAFPLSSPLFLCTSH